MTYVMGDIHGNMRRFKDIMDQIELGPEDTLYILGDIIDRHPDGLSILRQCMKMDNVRMILGNHEVMMMQAIGDPGKTGKYKTINHHALSIWYGNGGRVTHNALKHLGIENRKEIFNYLQSLPLNRDVLVNGIQYKLVHGGPVEEFHYGLSRYPDETQYAVWKRWEKGEWTPETYTMIFGHTPTDNYQRNHLLSIWYGEHLIGMDCGSGYPDSPDWLYDHQGRLACLRLDDLQEFYSREADTLSET